VEIGKLKAPTTIARGGNRSTLLNELNDRSRRGVSIDPAGSADASIVVIDHEWRAVSSARG